MRAGCTLDLVPFLLSRRLMPGTEVVVTLRPDAPPYAHARRMIRGVVDRHGRLTFYSSVTRGHIRIPLGDLGRAGYTVQRAESA
jgi:hypothetical protein